MEKKEYKYELGNFYGSRVSKNGAWLNLQIVTHINGQEWIITCPVKIAKSLDENHNGKPFAAVGVGKADIMGIKVYEEKKPEAQTEEIEIPDFI